MRLSMPCTAKAVHTHLRDDASAEAHVVAVDEAAATTLPIHHTEVDGVAALGAGCGRQGWVRRGTACLHTVPTQ